MLEDFLQSRQNPNEVEQIRLKPPLPHPNRRRQDRKVVLWRDESLPDERGWSIRLPRHSWSAAVHSQLLDQDSSTDELYPVNVDKEGGIHDFAWSPNDREFAVTYGCTFDMIRDYSRFEADPFRDNARYACEDGHL